MHGDPAETRQTHSETEHLLCGDSMEMGDMSPQQTREDKHTSQWVERYTDVQSNGQSSGSRPDVAGEEEAAPIVGGRTEYRVYRIRWFGLAQLILLNIVVSWDVGAIHLQCPKFHSVYSIANDYPAVALFLRRRQHRRRFLLYEP